MHISTWLNKQLKLIDKTKGIEKAKYQYELGRRYDQGTELNLRPDLAVIWYKRAAKNGSSEAQYKLAIAYANGTHGLEIRLDLAVQWFAKAVEKNHLGAQRALPEAQYKLANAYAYGRYGFKENPELSVLYYQQAVKNGSFEAQSRLPNAYYELAIMCQHGTGDVEKNLERAIRYYKLASGNGISEASYNLGCLYKNRAFLALEEQGIAIQEALYYFKQASFQGDQDAAIEIEQIYKENPTLRPEPPKPMIKPTSVPEGFNRQDRRKKPQTLMRQDNGELKIADRITASPIQVAEHQPLAEAAALTLGFAHHRQSTSNNHAPDQMRGSKTHLVLRTMSQKENRQENPPCTRAKLPPIPLFPNTLPAADRMHDNKVLAMAIEDYEFSEPETFKPF